MTKLAVVIPTRNRPEELSRLLGNLSAQTRPPDQVCVVDGSDPALDCEAVARSHGPGLDIRYTRLHPPSAAAQRNRGLDAVVDEADLVAMIDDDVSLEADALERAVREINLAPAEYIGFGMNPRDDDARRPYGPLKSSRAAESLGLYSSRLGVVMRSGWHTRLLRVPRDTEVEWLTTCAVIWKAAAIRRLRFDEFFEQYSYLEDLEFSLQARPFGKFEVLANVEYTHRPAPGGRKSAFWFGRREIRNRRYIVQKHRLSLGRFWAGTVVRMGLTGIDVARGRGTQAQRLLGNLAEMATLSLTKAGIRK